MKSFTIFIFLFVTGLCLADDRANTYIDNFLSTALSSEVRSLQIDRAIASEFEIKFEEHVRLIGNVKGEAEFKNGSVEGLDEIRRISECHLRNETKSKRVVNCTIGFDKLKVKYDGKLKYGRMPKMGINAKAKVSDTHIFLEIVQDSPMQPIIRNYTYTQKGTTKVKFTGLGPLNRFMNVLEEGYLKHVHAMLFEAMSQKLQYAINRALSKDMLPIHKD